MFVDMNINRGMAPATTGTSYSISIDILLTVRKVLVTTMAVAVTKRAVTISISH